MKVEEAEKKNEKNTARYLHILWIRTSLAPKKCLCSITCVGINVLEL